MSHEGGNRTIKRQSTNKKVFEQSRIRLVSLMTVFFLSFSAISVKLVEVSLAGKPDISRVAKAQNPKVAKKLEERLTSRSEIVDRNGTVLATSLATASLYAHPKVMTDIDEAVKKLSTVLSGLNQWELKKSLRSGKKFVWIKHNLTPTEQQAVNSLGVPGVYFSPEERRVYPYGNLFAHVLGYVDIDNQGLAGVEQYFNERLRSNPEPVQLSIDLRLQNIVAQELRAGMKEYSAIGATGIVLDLKKGEILSMVSLPSFDPHNPAKAPDVAKFNRAALGVYEMGSTFKTFTVAMALDEGVATMQGGYDATNPIKVARFTIRDTHPKRRWLSVPEIYAYSSNIGTVRMALDAGVERQREFLRKLGMFEPVKIELPEQAWPLVPNPWREINTITISYGHGLSVSPLHLVQGIATLVNDGKRVKMTLVKDGNKNQAEGDHVVKEDTSRNVRRLMRMVVQHGTGSKADTPGYRVGGKTGTAEKVMAGGRYKDDAKLASFIATFPVDDPKYVVLIMLDEPKGTKATYGYATGGWVSAPVADRVIRRMGPLMGIRPIFDVPEDDAERFWVDTTPRDLHAVAY